ncbi:hypothetical protein ADUPG1_012706 [Aduncisulcus paluster]|uniref:Gustatory receptor n=1 Tax=Aduncisulcus paluster TaxID=2918883 RepID=A0ABQ5K142_9EUKA|nr:hypothetical protein ADUPG1_012706 [Aduncisulcus paluster]
MSGNTIEIVLYLTSCILGIPALIAEIFFFSKSRKRSALQETHYALSTIKKRQMVSHTIFWFYLSLILGTGVLIICRFLRAGMAWRVPAVPSTLFISIYTFCLDLSNAFACLIFLFLLTNFALAFSFLIDRKHIKSVTTFYKTFFFVFLILIGGNTLVFAIYDVVIFHQWDEGFLNDLGFKIMCRYIPTVIQAILAVCTTIYFSLIASSQRKTAQRIDESMQLIGQAQKKLIFKLNFMAIMNVVLCLVNIILIFVSDSDNGADNGSIALFVADLAMYLVYVFNSLIFVTDEKVENTIHTPLLSSNAF